MPLKIYTGNRMENLVEALSSVLARPLASPFTPELLVVQSKGMQRWVAMELAKKLGIWANCDYPFPNKMVWDLFTKAFPNLSDVSSFAPEVMSWKVMALLPAFLGRAEFAPLAFYLAGDGDGLKRFQLSQKIADTFDQYTLFRPEMLRAWEEGNGGEWQELLWRELSAAGNRQHRGRLKEAFLALLADGEEAFARKVLPERISVFGISYLPSYHLDVLARVSEGTEVNLFLLSPCREFWGDIVSARELARRTPEEQDYLVEGHPLLASLGKMARDFCNMVVEGGAAAAEIDLYHDPGDATLLSALQSDILNLRGSGDNGEKRPIDPFDRSVQIHSCHSPLREIEVLHDNLLALLDADPALNCRDMVVMTPDIEKYAPYISMVFEGCQDPARKIPFSIADRSLASEGEVAGVLLKLLELPGSRLAVTSVFDLLEAAPVSRRFGFDAAGLELVRGWIEDTRIRWGVDEAHRESLGLPPYRDNSWRAGLDRLLLGYAMPEEDQLFNGILPYDEMEGTCAETLGRFAEFVQRVVRLVDTLSVRRSLAQWRGVLQTVLADFVDAGDELAHELSAVNRVVKEMDEVSLRGGFAEEVELPVVRSWVSSRLEKEEQGLGFLTGGVTFCAMLPMRSIPFPVVALIGMSDNAFPRQSRPPGFDLIARAPRPGDRSLRDEDRYLFLECLLSARKYLYISYLGQSVKDNSVVPPSVLVSEFLDAIDGGFKAPGGTIEERLVTRHRLQPFSRCYFDGSSGLFSYSVENCAALTEAESKSANLTPFIAGPLKEPPGEMREVSLIQLLRFFSNPARFLLENRLQIRLEEMTAPLEEREAFAVEGLEAYGLNQELLVKRLQGGDVGDFCAIARCRGILPPARHGEIVFADAVAEVEELVKKIETQCAGQTPLEPFSFQEELGEFRLSGRLEGVWTRSRILHRCANLKAKDEIRGWIEHLVLNAFAPEGYPRESILIMKNAVVTYAPVEDAGALLKGVLECYWEGLKMPLRFFPTSSLEYVCRNGDVEMARKKWETGFYPGEEENAHFQLCFRHEADPLDSRFEQLAQELLGPLVQHRS